jgi:hypothetical protein
VVFGSFAGSLCLTVNFCWRILGYSLVGVQVQYRSDGLLPDWYRKRRCSCSCSYLTTRFDCLEPGEDEDPLMNFSNYSLPSHVTCELLDFHSFEAASFIRCA